MNMYAYLRGTVGMTGENTIVVDCGGVGYEVLTTKTVSGKEQSRRRGDYLHISGGQGRRHDALWLSLYGGESHV